MYARSDKKQLLIVAEKRLRIRQKKKKKTGFKYYIIRANILQTYLQRWIGQIEKFVVKILELHKVAKQLSNLLLRRAPTFWWIHTALPICSYNRQRKKSLGHKKAALAAHCIRLVQTVCPCAWVLVSLRACRDCVWP